jgi:FdhD protein
MLSSKTVFSGCGGDTSYIDADFRLHTRTGGIHIVGLFGPDGKICIVEDIGRHNALDKIIGYGLKHNVDFSKTTVTCSGRLSIEMVRKCLIANIPIIASRGATTTLAISVGERSGLTIIGFVRCQKVNIYTGVERIRHQKST